MLNCLDCLSIEILFKKIRIKIGTLSKYFSSGFIL